MAGTDEGMGRQRSLQWKARVSARQFRCALLTTRVISRPAPSLRKQLQERFSAWCCGHGADVDGARALWGRLSERYEEAHRHNHHLGHLASSLEELDRCGGRHPAIEGAIWFHDVIYDPTRGDNETASIAWFMEETPWLDREMATEISRLIEATDFRTTPAGDPEVLLMIDIDLAILGSEPEEYDAYTRAIRMEYSHVSDGDFRKGRAKVMAHFLARPIYRTPGFASREERARGNISRELERLGFA